MQIYQYTLGGCQETAFVRTGNALLAYRVVLQVTSLYIFLGLYLLAAFCSVLMNHSENLSDFSALFANLKMISFRRSAQDFNPVF